MAALWDRRLSEPKEGSKARRRAPAEMQRASKTPRAKLQLSDSKLNARLLWLSLPWQSAARNSKLHSMVSP